MRTAESTTLDTALDRTDDHLGDGDADVPATGEAANDG